MMPSQCSSGSHASSQVENNDSAAEVGSVYARKPNPLNQNRFILLNQNWFFDSLRASGKCAGPDVEP